MIRSFFSSSISPLIVFAVVLVCRPNLACAQEVEAKELSALEKMRTAAAADVNERYGLLAEISPHGASREDRAEIVKLLIDELDDRFPDIRARAATALGLFGEDAAPAIPELIKLLGDTDQTVSLEGVWVPVSKAIPEIGAEHVLDPLMEELAKTFEVKITKNGAGEFEAELGDRVRYYGVCGAIAGLGEAAKSTAPTFIEILRTGPENRHWATMVTLSQLGDASVAAIPDFIRNLDHREFNFQVVACRALAKHGKLSAAAAPKLVKLMEKNKDNMLSTRTHAAMCLGAIGPIEGIDSVKLLKNMIQEANAFSQERGLIGLGRLGDHAKDATEFVESLLDKKGFSQKPEAARTLWQITGKAERPLEELMKRIKNPTYDTRVHAILKEMGSAALPVADKLAEDLNNEDQSQRQIVLEIFGSMGPTAKDYVDAIEESAKDASPDTRAVLEKTLTKMRGD